MLEMAELKKLPLTADRVLRLMRKYNVRVYPDLRHKKTQWFAGVVVKKNGINYIPLHKLGDGCDTPEAAMESLIEKMRWENEW